TAEGSGRKPRPRALADSCGSGGTSAAAARRGRDSRHARRHAGVCDRRRQEWFLGGISRRRGAAEDGRTDSGGLRQKHRRRARRGDAVPGVCGMKGVAQDLAFEYASLLKAYLTKNDEGCLQRAYELGRLALSQNVGLLQLTALHNSALTAVLKEISLADANCQALR